MKANDRFLYIDFAEYRHEGKGSFFLYIGFAENRHEGKGSFLIY